MVLNSRVINRERTSWHLRAIGNCKQTKREAIPIKRRKKEGEYNILSKISRVLNHAIVVQQEWLKRYNTKKA